MTDSFVYVGEIINKPTPRDQPFQFHATHKILEIPRAQISSLKFDGPDTLRPDLDTPAQLVWTWLSNAKERITTKSINMKHSRPRAQARRLIRSQERLELYHFRPPGLSYPVLRLRG